MTLYLPDVSEWQPRTDPKGIAKKNGGALIIRAGYGASHKDLVFDSLRSKAHKGGVKSLGIYHYVTSGTDITAQANAFVKWVGKRQAGEWFCIDLEEGGGNQRSRAVAWMNIVTKKLGGFVTIYSGNYFIGAHGLSSLYTSGEGWVAAYGSTPTHKYLLHQYSDGKYSPRISWSGAGYCDTNRYNGSLDAFVKKTTGSVTASSVKEDDLEVLGISLERNGQEVSANKADWVWWSIEHDDTGKQHSASNPGIVTGKTVKAVDLQGNVSGVKGKCYFVAYNMVKKKERFLDEKVHEIGETCRAVGKLYSNEHVYLKIVPTEAGKADSNVRGIYFR